MHHGRSLCALACADAERCQRRTRQQPRSRHAGEDRMAGSVLGVADVVTLLGLVASLVAAASVMRRAHRAATERSPSLALEAAFGAAATLILATLFFNHQPQRQIRHAAPPWTAKDDSREPN